MRKTTALALATMLAITPITGVSATGVGDTGMTTTTERDDDRFPWGLLGLLGLAGLLGLKGRDRDDHRPRTTDTAPPR